MNTKMLVTYMIFLASAGAGAVLLAADADATKYAIAPGKFEPTWESLKQHECPEWFRDAKFGIWAHWGVQCVPEQGDWYAWHMYRPSGDRVFKYHLEHYGHPSKFGLKDLCNAWKAEKWDPEKLIQLYKRAGRNTSSPWPTITTISTTGIPSTSRETRSTSARRGT